MGQIAISIMAKILGEKNYHAIVVTDNNIHHGLFA